MTDEHDFEQDETPAWHEDNVVGLPLQAPVESPVEAPEEPAEPEAPEPTSPSRQPELGNPVHFVLPVGPNQGQDRLALVSLVLDGEGDRERGLVDCHIFGLPQDHPNVTSTHLVRFAQRVPYSQQRQPGTWHWPGEGE